MRLNTDTIPTTETDAPMSRGAQMLEPPQDVRAELRRDALLQRAATPAPPFHCSGAFLTEARRAGVSEASLLAALGTGRRKRQWDGCVLVRDWMTGVELRLDPSERFGINVRRVA